MGALGVNDLDRETKLAEIEKLCSSSVLHGSESLCNLLRFLATQTLDRPGSTVKEYQIATEVFGRAADFDPRLDSTVRVQTGRLRSKLAEYYASDGIEDQVVVEIPRGSYHLIFHYREPAPRLTASELVAVPAPAPIPRRSPKQWTTTAVVSVIAVMAALTLDFAFRPVFQHGPAAESTDALQALWLRFFDGPEPPLVVYSNAAFVGRPETGLRYFNAANDTNSVILDHYTGVGEVMAIHELDNLFTSLHRGMRLKRGRLLTWDDAKASNLIFIGSPSENLSLREMPGTQDFIFKVASDGPRKGDLSIVNVHPRPGEENTYLSTAALPIREDYAVVGLVPGLTNAQHALVLAGLTTLGTQAAAEFVCRTKRLEELLGALSAPSKGPFPPFEALLRVKVSGGVPVQSDLVAAHRHK
ncbi:MAG: helix-turn-helix domain-containing protein [Acidobacteriia bacterium]|nr:helix-turn-helix domain-containing protein [Terriglobia bacterium]